MSNNTYQQLAKEMLDLWQKQLSSVVSDKQFIHAMLDMIQSMQKGTYGQSGEKSAYSNASAAPDDANRLSELAFRVAMCEKRLAALESAASNKKPKTKPRAVRKSPAKRSAKPRR
ncbi:MAG: hypothetical protein ACK502_05975 [Alphaproteobacteria bacterium]